MIAQYNSKMSKPTCATYAQTIQFNGDLANRATELRADVPLIERQRVTNITLKLAEVKDLKDSVAVSIALLNVGVTDAEREVLLKAARWSQQIHDLIDSEKKMLHPSAQKILASYLEGNAAFYLAKDDENNERAIGFCRFIPALSKSKIEQLGLPENFPEIFELGTVIVDQSRRERGTGSITVATLHNFHNEGLIRNRRLIIGTTTTALMLGTLRSVTRANPNLGISYYRTSHITQGLELIGASTCVCEANEVAGSSPAQVSLGMHHGLHACSVRSSDASSHRLNDYTHQFPFAQGSCMMFVSNIDLAKEANNMLSQRLGDINWKVEDYTAFIMQPE